MGPLMGGADWDRMLSMSGRMQAGIVSHARPPGISNPMHLGTCPTHLGTYPIHLGTCPIHLGICPIHLVTPESLRRFRGRTRAGRHPQNAACSRVRCGRRADTHLRVPSTRETRGVAALLSEGSRSIQVASTYADAHARAHARGGMQYCRSWHFCACLAYTRPRRTVHEHAQECPTMRTTVHSGHKSLMGGAGHTEGQLFRGPFTGAPRKAAALPKTGTRSP